MITFLGLIYKKLLFAIGISALLFYVVLLIMMVALAIAKDNPGEFMSMEVILMNIPISIGCAIMVIIIAFFTEYYDFYLQRKLFQKKPFSQLGEIGFVPVQLLEKSKWKFYKEAHCARINGFYVLADKYSKGKGNFTLLTHQVSPLNIQIPEKYREIESSKNDAGIVLTIPTDSYWTPDVRSIQELLQYYASAMKVQGCKPADNFSQYERKIIWDMMMRGLGPALGGS
jgi:hypothetical protein